MSLLIFYLTNDDRHYTFPHFIELLDKSNKKDMWKIIILTHSNDEDFYKNIIENYKIDNDIFLFESHNNYMNKAHFAVKYAEEYNYNYIMKCDNDIFLNPQALDFMIENLYILENPNHLTIGPTLSSGIPSVEYFVEDFLNEDEQNHIKNLFKNTKFHNFDIEPYSILNKYTIESDTWDVSNFFKGVKEMNHYYKGIHPIRINMEAIQYLNSCIINNKENFISTKKQLSIINNDSSPYLCDSIFCIKRDIYKSIINNHSLFVDGVDEVPLNKYAWNNNMNHLFVKNGFAIHMYYNWHPFHFDNEKIFINKFFT